MIGLRQHGVRCWLNGIIRESEQPVHWKRTWLESSLMVMWWVCGWQVRLVKWEMELIEAGELMIVM
jgi:hypothetical protein